MKDLIPNVVADIFRKADLPSLRSRLLALLRQIKTKKILSLQSLLISGFLLAVIPLFFAVLYAAFGMREISTLGRAVNSQVFEQTKLVHSVLQKTADIERKARLFVLLSDPAIRQPYERESYENTRTAFKQALHELLKLSIDSKTALSIKELSEKEELIYQQIISSANDNNIKLPVDEAFRGLRESSYGLSRIFEDRVNHQFAELRRQSESAEHGLLIKGALLLIISVIFIMLLLAVIARSIRQLDGGIRRLGSGTLEQPIEVDGPADLRYLGSRLEWLRTHLLELEVSKQQFIRNVAVEIDLPVESIRASAEQLINSADPEPDNVRQSLARLICDNVDKLKTVADELTRYSQLNSAPAMKHKETVDIKHLLDSVIEEFQPSLQAKSIRLKKLLKPVKIHGINSQLRSIIEQLLSNAVKYSPMNGEIRIILRDSGDLMELEIEDEGPGIEADQRLRVFEPFFRGKNSQYGNDAEGQGLGLALVREYVANHQGKVAAIDSRQDQHGARLRVQIPLNEAP